MSLGGDETVVGRVGAACGRYWSTPVSELFRKLPTKVPAGLAAELAWLDFGGGDDQSHCALGVAEVWGDRNRDLTGCAYGARVLDNVWVRVRKQGRPMLSVATGVDWEGRYEVLEWACAREE